MEKKIMFCNIAWMKNYLGVTEDDRPKNGGQYIKDVGRGGEVYSFLDDNGKCHGFVRINGNIALENHFKDAKANDDYIDDMLVVFVATNKNNENHIVGWYKNARVYRQDRDLTFFYDYANSFYYNIEADASNCYLLTEENRSFQIDRASQVGRGMGFGQSNIWYAESEFAQANIVPRVLEYIENYRGPYNNFVYDSWDIEKEIEKLDFLKNYDKLYQRGAKSYEEKNYKDALVYFKAAQKIKEPIELTRYLAQTFFFLLRYEESTELFDKIIEKEGETMDSLVYMLSAYDYIRDIEKTIEYCKKIISFDSDSYEDMERKIDVYWILFNIYIYKNKEKDAKETMNILEDYLKNTAEYSKEDMDRVIDPMKDTLAQYKTH